MHICSLALALACVCFSCTIGRDGMCRDRPVALAAPPCLSLSFAFTPAPGRTDGRGVGSYPSDAPAQCVHHPEWEVRRAGRAWRSRGRKS